MKRIDTIIRFFMPHSLTSAVIRRFSVSAIRPVQAISLLLMKANGSHQTKPVRKLPR